MDRVNYLLRFTIPYDFGEGLLVWQPFGQPSVDFGGVREVQRRAEGSEPPVSRAASAGRPVSVIQDEETGGSRHPLAWNITSRFFRRSCVEWPLSQDRVTSIDFGKSWTPRLIEFDLFPAPGTITLNS